ncbi:cysteine protease [Lithospermum erythrorhizon]|uniref:Cysteine protease n=1 Tax=Lithospermum erythrorhizon TaxID=34254 RepID=A0AAV3RS58_LITER
MTVMDFSGTMLENGSIGIPWKPKEELKVIQDLMREAEANPKEGDLYYVISSRLLWWFANWQKYTQEAVSGDCMDDTSQETCSSMISNSGERPRPIDNTHIVIMDDDDPQLYCNMEEDRDYKLIPHKVWQELYGWYKGGPALPRKMISLGDNNQLSVEVFPLCLNLIDSGDDNGTVIRLSRKASLHELYERVGGLKSLDPQKVHLWDHFNSTARVLLISSETTLEEALLVMNNNILVEVQANGTWPSGNDMDSTGNELALVPVEPMGFSVTSTGGRTLANSSDSFGGSGFSYIFGDSDDCFENLKDVPEDIKGQAGLQNLGNTCFMNSALQCLIHTPQLVDYFLKDFSDEINKDNLLGMNGELALGFGSLLRKLWLSGRRPVAPREFKGKLGRFAPQFSGYNQHDSQELLAFLLDGLHEDLNRVKKKPYIESKDFDDRPDSEVAEEFWRYHKARNDSVIVDTCQGQYKSTLVCPVCEKISITFDPFMYLSLPLPSRATREMTVTVFYGDGSRLPMPYTVTVLKLGCCADLQKALGAACFLRNDEYLLLAEVFGHCIYRYYESPTEPLASIKDVDNIVAYILPQRASELTRLEICHCYLERATLIYMTATERKLFLTPLVTFLENPQYGADIDLAVSRILSPLRREPPCTSTMIKLLEETGTSAKAADTPDNESNTCAVQENLSTGSLESKQMEISEMTSQICIKNDHGLNSRPIVKDTPIRPERMLKVFLDWFEEDEELYDITALWTFPRFTT